MYEYIEGKYKGLNKDYVIIDNNGIGYKIFTSGNSICSMPLLNENVRLYVEQVVRQDFIGLYGFIDKQELEMFLKLININGIGAKAALSLLSVNTVDTLKKAICCSDETILMKASGVGKKSAQRIILELKDKFKVDNNQEIMDEKSYVDTNYKSLEATQALLSLGFEEKHINVVLLEVMERFPDESLESIIKECLKNLMR
ncbi:Holliday junction branch migration protein RuvA [Candidatus Arthromitus sp. SFB-turkey]|uniref:Holliday junction branch migration protein RuvA n=1 Tax=Candidatus Arthromitus sp. SFB-turkey TaxID=1840217 RepID=UPI0007F41A32|nr:Holliday junction branch migration protein RuvA [Candidatus Arthromitus sp. SFB-turkey]OAT89073.1 Holliday junction DNA helicase RuvA [Candidatus Arthromitus sp. SFB-turkey]